MEVEVKLRLPDAAAHRRLSAYLAPRLLRTDAQRNAFFDAPARPLRGNRRLLFCAGLTGGLFRRACFGQGGAGPRGTTRERLRAGKGGVGPGSAMIRRLHLDEQG